MDKMTLCVGQRLSLFMFLVFPSARVDLFHGDCTPSLFDVKCCLSRSDKLSLSTFAYLEKGCQYGKVDQFLEE